VIKVMISKAGKLADGTVAPLTANLTSVAAVMAATLKETAFDNNKKLTFDVRKPSALSDEYMRLLGSRFGNKEGWASYARQQSDQAKPKLRLGEKGWTWASSDLWHKIARKDDASFNRTGGMWAGLRVRNFGAKGAIIEFAGRSEGQTGEWKKSKGRAATAGQMVTVTSANGQTTQYFKAGRKAKEAKEKWSGKVANALKAWTVFQQKNVLLLEPDTKTQAAFEQSIEIFAAKWLDGQTSGKQTIQVDKGNPLAVRFANAFG